MFEFIAFSFDALLSFEAYMDNGINLVKSQVHVNNIILFLVFRISLF